MVHLCRHITLERCRLRMWQSQGIFDAVSTVFDHAIPGFAGFETPGAMVKTTMKQHGETPSRIIYHQW